MAKPHYFPFYYQDFFHGTRRFTLAQRGAYLELICECWELGTIKEHDFAHIKAAFFAEERSGERALESGEERALESGEKGIRKGRRKALEWGEVMAKFYTVKGGGYRHRKVDTIREGVKLRSEIAKKNGRLGGQATSSKRVANAIANAVAKQVANDPAKKRLLNLKSKILNLKTKSLKPKTKIKDLNPLNTKSKIKDLNSLNIWSNFFDQEFWPAWPYKVKKQEARRMMKKINPDVELQETIMKALAQQKHCEQWTKDNGKYIPQPTSWLNGKRWEDEQPAIIAKPRKIESQFENSADANERVMNKVLNELRSNREANHGGEKPESRTAHEIIDVPSSHGGVHHS